MRQPFSSMVIGVICAVLFTACDSIPLNNVTSNDRPQWHLTETVLPQQHANSARLKMIFSPDGSRIAVRNAGEIELISINPLKLLTAFETGPSSNKWAKYLDSNTIAFDQDSGASLLLDDLTRRPLPNGTVAIRNDGRFVVVSGENRSSDKSNEGVVETATGRRICTMQVGAQESITINQDYAAFGRRGNVLPICELATGKSILLRDADHAVWTKGVLDPMGKFLLVISTRDSLLVSGGRTNAKLYRLPLEPARILSTAQRDNETEIEVRPIKTWDWYTSMKAAFSPDGNWLMISSHQKSELLKTNALDEPIPLRIDSKFLSIHFSRDSKWLATEDSKFIYLAKLEGVPGFMRLAIPGKPDDFAVTDIAPDGSAFIGIMSPKLTDTPKRILWRIEASPK